MATIRIMVRRGLALAALAAGLAAHAALPTAYFPTDAREPATADGWQALADEYPRWIKPVRPDPTREIDSPAATLVPFNDTISYIRVRRLKNDLENIKTALAHPGLVIDLRYVHGDRNETIRLGQVLARRQVALATANAANEGDIVIDPNPDRAADQVTLVVVNGGTSGPLEALLDALQAQGDVLLVGTRTAGDTGMFRRPESGPGWQVIYGDLRRRGGPTLLDVGVEPGLKVETKAAEEEVAYLGFDGGTTLTDLLDAPVEKARFDEERLLQQFDESHPDDGAARRRPAPRAAESEDGENTASEEDEAAAEVPFDRSLHRAISTLVALEALGKL